MTGLRAAVRAHPVPWLITLAYAFAWLLLVPAMLAGRHVIPLTVPGALLVFPLGYTPAAAALLVAWLTDGRTGVRELGRALVRWRIPLHWYAAATGGPLVVFLAGLGVSAALGLRVATFGPAWLIAVAFCVNLLLAAVVNGEEIAWRGTLLPMLQARTAALPASLLVGLAEALFHLPLFLTPGTPQSRIPFAGFLLLSLALSTLFSFLYNSTGGSLVTVTLMHGAVNASTNVLPVPSSGPVFWVLVLLTALLAVSVVGVTGTRDLARRSRAKWPVPDSSVAPAVPGDHSRRLRHHVD